MEAKESVAQCTQELVEKQGKRANKYTISKQTGRPQNVDGDENFLSVQSTSPDTKPLSPRSLALVAKQLS